MVRPLEKVIAANCTNPVVIPIPSQQFFAKPKESRMWNAVILQNDCFFNVVEKPTEAAGVSLVATHINF